jgi:hypothetical protein
MARAAVAMNSPQRRDRKKVDLDKIRSLRPLVEQTGGQSTASTKG